MDRRDDLRLQLQRDLRRLADALDEHFDEDLDEYVYGDQGLYKARETACAWLEVANCSNPRCSLYDSGAHVLAAAIGLHICDHARKHTVGC